MSKLIIKSRNENSIGNERYEMLSQGKTLMSSNGSIGGNLNGPSIESVGVSDMDFGNSLENGPAMLKGSSNIGRIEREVLTGNVKMSGLTSGADITMSPLGMSVRQAILENKISMDGNSLIDSWDSLWDAKRIDLTIQKALNPSVRGFFYNEQDTPDADAVMNITEFFPDAVVFEENNGTGQSVEMGELMGGQTDTMEQVIYAAGLTYDLKKELFDRTLNFTNINNAVAIGESGKKDDVALKPIFDFAYAAEAKTAANTTGATREEKLYLTLDKAIDDLESRRDPVTQALLSASGARILASPAAARHIQLVASGFQGVDVNVKKRPALTAISNIIGYEGTRIIGRSKNTTYTDVPDNTAYMMIPNRYMLLAAKRRLQLNVDQNPDVTRLSRQQMAWWYCEAQYNYGIGYFIQEITLPAW